MSQQQFASLIVSSMKQAHGQEAPVFILRQACAYERSDHSELATIWRKAHDQIVICQATSSRLAEQGYISDDS
jgi:hypothetical protein